MGVRAAAAFLRAAALVLLAALPAAAQDTPPPNPLCASKDLTARLQTAADLKKKDHPAYFRALLALGTPNDATKSDPAAAADDAEFLVEHAIRELDRAHRLTALHGARALDPKKAAVVARKHCDAAQKDVTRLALATDALSYLGAGEADVKLLLGLAAHPSELVATAAARGLARVAKPGDVPEIIDVTLKHGEPSVSDQGAWTVQDLLKKPKVALEKYEKIAESKKDPRSLRADATLSLLKEAALEPQKWGDTLGAAVTLLAAAPPDIPVEGPSEALTTNVRAGLDWMKDATPGSWLLMRSCVKRISVPGANAEYWIDFDKEELSVPVAMAAKLKPSGVAYNLSRMASLMFAKKIGEPWKSARGWQPALFDIYDLCAAGKLENCGPGGIDRERFVRAQLGKQPWN